MDLGISGKKAVVCASSKGLGLGCANALADAGVDLTLCARNETPLQLAAKTLRKKGVKVNIVICDITTDQGIAKVLEKSCGLNDDGTIWIRGSNDSHLKFGAKHTRTVCLNLSFEREIYFNVIDEVICNKKMYWRQFWHLGPDQSEDLLKEMILQLKERFELEEKWFFTWYSIGFGKRIRRKTLKISGVIDRGIHKFNNKLVI